jgi:hypothetical protein
MADEAPTALQTADAIHVDYRAALVAYREAGARLQAALEAEIRTELSGEWVALEPTVYLHWLRGEHGLRHWLLLTRRLGSGKDPAAGSWRVGLHRSLRGGETEYGHTDSMVCASAVGRSPAAALRGLVGTMKVTPLNSYEITSLIRSAP